MQNMSVNFKNWQTTVVGFLTGVGMCVAQLINLFDSDPETVFQLTLFMAGLGAMGLGFFAKDGNKSSRKLGLSVLLLGVLLFGMAGCICLSSGYVEQAESAAIVVAEYNERCQAGEEAACREGLEKSDETLRWLVRAMHGKGEEVDPNGI